MISNKTIALVSRDVVLTSEIDKQLKDSFNITHFSHIRSALDYIYNSLPDLLIMDVGSEDKETLTLLSDLKRDPIFGQIPVMAIVEDSFVFCEEECLVIDDYLRENYVEKEIYMMTKLCITRTERVVETNPLTRLPGNITIAKQIQQRLDRGETFAVAYTDLDYFKPYNDKYGFSRGDEVLKMLGRLVLNIVKQWQPQDSFIGHIGGDDFVFIVRVDIVEKLAQEIIDTFGRIVQTFYDGEDRTKKCIDSVDREGIRKKFPIMGLSIGIAQNQFRGFSHYGEMAEVASEMKKYAKTSGGGCYKIDKRKD